MILPSKHLSKDRAIISVGAEILAQLNVPRTVSELWEAVSAARGARKANSPSPLIGLPWR
jgi:hypothetical protein